jgi:hypothetical protein
MGISINPWFSVLDQMFNERLLRVCEFQCLHAVAPHSAKETYGEKLYP